MDDDNLYPLDGGAFVPTEPLEQKQERDLEKGKALAALPLLEDIIARFDEQIALLGDIDSIPQSTRADEKMLLANFHANDISKRFLVGQKEWLEGLIDDYTKR